MELETYEFITTDERVNSSVECPSSETEDDD